MAEIVDGLFKLVKSVPDEATPVEARRVARVELNNAVKVLESQIQPIATNFLPDGAQVVQGRDVAGLKLNGRFVVLLRLFEFAKFIPAKRSVVKCLEMVGI